MAGQGILAVLVGILLCACSQITKENLMAISLKARKLPYDACGQSIFQEKVYGDSSTTLGTYPWMAALGYNRTDASGGFTWLAAGSLITDQYILTVAHALEPNIPSRFTLAVVRLGDLNLDDMAEDGASPVDMEVEKAIPHPDYDVITRTNDIGLIKLKNKVQYDYLKSPICLPSPEFHKTSFVGRSSIIIGWGTNEKGKTSSLSETSVEIQDFDRCKMNYNKIWPKVVMDERVFCASSPGKDACSGDTGGPLMMYRRYKGKSKMFIMGIVSYGYKCALEDYPGIYTNVSSFMYWIVDNLEL